jgi:hypothetical protein
MIIVRVLIVLMIVARMAHVIMALVHVNQVGMVKHVPFVVVSIAVIKMVHVIYQGTVPNVIVTLVIVGNHAPMVLVHVSVTQLQNPKFAPIMDSVMI